MQIVIDIPENLYRAVINGLNPKEIWYLRSAIKKGIQLPGGHGRLIDISKLDDDRIESWNPVICLKINGEYIEAVSLDYINSLSTIVEADTESGGKE